MRDIFRFLFISILFMGSACAAGYFDIAAANRFAGWACDPNSPNSQIQVDIWRDDGLYLGGRVANSPRKQAVATACNSTHSSHGFDFVPQLNASAMDNRSHTVRAYAISTTGGVTELIGSPKTVVFGTLSPQPKNIGDIVGRDFERWRDVGLGVVGHVGFWDGAQVVEAYPNPNPDENALHLNSYAAFQSKTTAWTPVLTNLPDIKVTGCFEKRCINFLPSSQGGQVQTLPIRQAMKLRALQMQGIGASYTVSSYYISASPGDAYHEPAKGKYRCDSFVLSLFDFTIPYGNSLQTNVDTTWHNKVMGLHYLFPFIPKTLYDAIAKF